jgi:hypothetical protein
VIYPGNRKGSSITVCAPPVRSHLGLIQGYTHITTSHSRSQEHEKVSEESLLRLLLSPCLPSHIPQPAAQPEIICLSVQQPTPPPHPPMYAVQSLQSTLTLTLPSLYARKSHVSLSRKTTRWYRIQSISNTHARLASILSRNPISPDAGI